MHLFDGNNLPVEYQHSIIVCGKLYCSSTKRADDGGELLLSRGRAPVARICSMYQAVSFIAAIAGKWQKVHLATARHCAVFPDTHKICIIRHDYTLLIAGKPVVLQWTRAMLFTT